MGSHYPAEELLGMNYLGLGELVEGQRWIVMPSFVMGLRSELIPTLAKVW
jgi:hypothetical protein